MFAQPVSPEDKARKDEKARRQNIIQDNVLLSQGKPALNDTSRNPKPPEAPKAEQQQQQQQPAAGGPQIVINAPHPEPSMAGRFFGHHQNMVDATNDAWREEMNSRVAQSQAGAERQHEQQLAMIQAQGRKQQEAAAMASAQTESQARIQKNNAIMGMMGYGTKTVNGQKIGPFESFSQSLLGR